MKNTIQDLNNYLFEQLERIQDDTLTEEEMQKEMSKAQVVSKIADTIIKNGDLALRTMTTMNTYGYGLTSESLAPVPKMLLGGKDE